MKDNTERLIIKYREYEDNALIDLRDDTELVDDAFLALNQVLSERGLKIKEPVVEEFDDFSHDDYEEGDDLVTVTRFATPTEAYVFQGCLESEGVPAFVADANLVQANSFLVSAVGWVRVQVAEKDLERAKDIFISFENGDYSIDDNGNPQAQEFEDEYIDESNLMERSDSISESGTKFFGKIVGIVLKVAFVLIVGSFIARNWGRL